MNLEEEKYQLLQRWREFLKEGTVADTEEYKSVVTRINQLTTPEEFNNYKQQFKLPILKAKLIRIIESNQFAIFNTDDISKSDDYNELLNIQKQVELEIKKTNFLNDLKNNPKVDASKSAIEKIIRATSDAELTQSIKALPYGTKFVLDYLPKKKKKRKSKSARLIFTPMGNKER